MTFKRCFYYTNKGDKRVSNQDALALQGKVVTGDMDDVEEFVPAKNAGSDAPHQLYAVIDGMGGEAGGALAARLIAEVCSAAVCNSPYLPPF